MRNKLGHDVASQWRQSVSTLALALGASALIFAAASPARADDSASVAKLEKEMHRLEAQHAAEIKALKVQIHQIQAHRGGPVMAPGGVVTKGPYEPCTGPFVTMSPTHQFGLSSCDGLNSIYFTGEIQLDAAGQVGGNAHMATPAGADFRRARIGIGGRFMGDWDYLIRYEMGGAATEATGANPVASAGTLENAFLQYNGFYNHHQAFPVSLTIGAIDVPWTLDEPTGNDKVMFIERSSAQQLANTLGNAGDNRIAVGATSNDNHYFLGAWVTGPTTDTVRTFGVAPGNYGPPLAVLGRGAYEMQFSPDFSAHIGANYSYVWNPTTASAAGYTPTLSPSGTAEIGILGTLPGTGTGAIPVKSSQVFGAEAAAQYGNAFVQAEYYHYIVDGTYGAGAAVIGGLPGPSANFDGGYAEASYTFGGRRTYAPKYAAYSGVIPDHPFVLGTNDFGAVELGARFGIIGANDRALSVLTVAPTSAALHGWTQENFAAVLNWYPNTNIRFDLEYEHVIDNQMSLLSGAYTSSNKLDWIGGRTQVTW